MIGLPVRITEEAVPYNQNSQNQPGRRQRGNPELFTKRRVFHQMLKPAEPAVAAAPTVCIGNIRIDRLIKCFPVTPMTPALRRLRRVNPG